MTEKQVLFESRVDVVTTPPPPTWALAASIPEYPSSVPSSVPSSGELGWPLVSLAKVSSTGYSRFGLQHEGTGGGPSSHYNYGYSTPELPGQVGLVLFSNCEDSEDLDNRGCSRCAWVRDPKQKWIVSCWTCIALLALCILVVLAMILVFCIVVPRSPHLEVPDRAILVHALNVTRNPLLLQQQQGARFSGRFTLQLLVRNPNRVKTDYSSSSFSMLYGDTVVGEATLAAFSQKAHGSSEKLVDLIADGNVLQESARTLLSDATVYDNLSLQVHGRVKARLQIMGLSCPPVLTKLRCSITIKVEERQVTDQHCHFSKQKVIW